MRMCVNYEARTYLDNLITGKLEFGNVCCIACHEVPVKHTKHGFVGDDQEIVFFALKLENDGLHAYGKVVVRFCTGVSVMVWIYLVLFDFLGELFSNLGFGHLLAYTGVHLAHLRSLPYAIAHGS